MSLSTVPSNEKAGALAMCEQSCVASNEPAKDIKMLFSSHEDPNAYMPKFINWIFVLQIIYESAKSALKLLARVTLNKKKYEL